MRNSEESPMKRIRNEKGITLIEVLATITILSIVSFIIYNVFSSGLRYSSQAKETVLIQQEANYLLTLLKEQHENATTDYTITIENNQNNIILNKGHSNEIDVTNSQYLYQICDLDQSDSCDEQNATDHTITITPSQERFYLKMILTNKNNPDIKYEIQTILSRL